MKKTTKIIIAMMISLLVILTAMGMYIWLNPKVAVLCYHNIATLEEIEKFPEENDWLIDINNFEEQLKYLAEHDYKTLTTKEFLEWKKGEISIPYKSVLITFDDGFLSNYQYAFPLLKKYNMNATVFLIGQYMEDGNKEWNGNVKAYVTKDILKKCQEEYPNIEFASHSFGLHEQGSVYEKTVEEMTQDLSNFESQIVPTKVYAYPFGAKNDKIKQALYNNHYNLAFTYGPNKKDYRKASKQDNDYEIPRLNVSHGMEISKFALRLLLPF